MPTKENKESSNKDKRIGASLILSILAIIISGAQLIVSSPYYNDYYYEASFSIEEAQPLLTGKDYSSVFVITNNSKNPVNNIEIGIQVLKGDKVQFIPNQNIEITNKDNGIFKDSYFSINKLVPNESITFMVHSNSDSIIYFNDEFFKKMTPVKNDLDTNDTHENPIVMNRMQFPNIILAKFDKGAAEVIRLPKHDIINMLKNRAK